MLPIRLCSLNVNVGPIATVCFISFIRLSISGFYKVGLLIFELSKRPPACCCLLSPSLSLVAIRAVQEGAQMLLIYVPAISVCRYLSRSGGHPSGITRFDTSFNY